MNVSEILNKAADLIEPEGAWSQNGVRNASGARVQATSPEACSWDAMNALFAVCGDSRVAYPASCLVDDVIGGQLLGIWNDAPERTQAEVVAALRKAAEAAS